MDLNTVSNIVDVTINVLTVVGGSSVAAAFLPKPTDNAIKIYQIVRKVIDFVGANWLNAKNG